MRGMAHAHALADVHGDVALDHVLEQVAQSAGALAAVLAVECADGLHTWHAGDLDVRDAAALAEGVLEGGPVPDHVLVTEVPCRTCRAVLAVVHDATAPLDPAAHRLLAAAAAHAGVALELRTVLEAGTRESERMTRLARLTHDVATASDEQRLADVVAQALPGLTGARAATVMRLEPKLGELHVVAAHGHAEPQREHLLATAIRASEVPELAAMLNRREPAVLHVATASESLHELLSFTGSATVIAVPLIAEDQLLGVLTAGWAQDDALADTEAEVLDSLVSLAELASTSWHNLRLLAAVHHQSTHDGLTGLANRTSFRNRLDEVLRDAVDGEGTAVVLCDLDRFTGINQLFGHSAGDEMLRQVAARLGGELRAQDVVARLAGDEFAVLLVDVDEQRADAVAHRLVDSLDSAFRIEGRDLRITVSVGLAVHDGGGGRGDRLLAAADQAMRDAKQRGRNQVVMAGAEESAPVVPSLEAELAQAAGSNQLRLFFQPLVDVTTPDGGVVGAEALLRWAHPRLGLLSPAAFLPLAEESGLVTELDLWAVDAACAALAGLEPGPVPLRIAVNMASATLLDPRMLPTIRTALATRGLEPGRLEIEVVESRALADLPGVVDAMRELRQLGVRLSLDDFGTGYSTLSWLHSLPVDQIKIDRSFVMRLPDDGASVAVVRGVLALARELSIEVVAEGVEDAEQLASLRAAGCDIVQGYLLGRPGPVLLQQLVARESA